MKSPLRKIVLAFVAIALLPVLFLVYELVELNKNEKIVRDAYQNQLDAILYSVNQYSDDVISSWANLIRQQRREHPAVEFPAHLNEVINQSDVVRYFYMSDLDERSVAYRLFEQGPDTSIVRTAIDKIVRENLGLCEKLIRFSEAGFRKMQAVNQILPDESVPILFALDNAAGDYRIGVLVVNLPALIKYNLGPKMQAISHGKMIISAYRVADDSLIYSTDPSLMTREARESAREFKDLATTKDFWVLPGYYVGITVIGASLQGLVEERTTSVIFVLAVLILLFGGGFYFLYRNVRREIYLSQAKSEFVSNVSHEIRTPLSLIGMFAETLETGRVKTEEKKLEYYGIISKETARLSRIVNRILNFSQLEANKKAFNMQPLSINDLCHEALKMYFFPMQEKGFNFEFHPDATAREIRGDKESLSEVLVNLVDNAIKYSRDQKHVTISTGVEGKYTFVAVRDRGIGIARNHQRDIFDQFYRAPTGDVHTTKGSGLGLTLVKRIVETHGGYIGVESTPGKGSTFTVYIPYINTGT